MHYVDTTAATKLVISEPETAPLVSWIDKQNGRLITSDLTRTELLRAVKRYAPDRLADARAVLETLDIVSLSRTIFDAAGRIDPPQLRSLDALHLAIALDLGDDLDALITYDVRMADAAQSHGIPVITPQV